MFKFWFDKYTIPTWVEIISCVVLAVVLAVEFVAFI